MLQGKLRFGRIWRAFFAAAPPGSYNLWIHCAKQDCDGNHPQLEVPGSVIVQHAPSMRCFDLVTPLRSLAKTALESGVHKDVLEKFIVVSDTSLPVKPFPYTFRQLTSRPESDYCLHSTSGARWPSVKMRYSRRRRRTSLYIEKGEGQEFFLVKHQQFVVLNRKDAQALVDLWDIPEDPTKITKTWKAPLVGQYWKMYDTRIVKKLPRVPMGWFDKSGRFCADEIAPYALAHGIFLPGQDLRCPLDWSTQCSTTDDLMKHKRCSTLSVGRKNSLIEEMQRQDEELDLAEEDSHAIAFSKIGRKSMILLRNSSYLFARKFSKSMGADALAGYVEIMLS